jgi:hypothetical protein
VLGVAVLASVFARHGVYGSPPVFIDGFTRALWVAAGFSAFGLVAAMLAPGRPSSDKLAAPAQPVLALIGERA